MYQIILAVEEVPSNCVEQRVLGGFALFDAVKLISLLLLRTFLFCWPRQVVAPLSKFRYRQKNDPIAGSLHNCGCLIGYGILIHYFLALY